MVSVTTQHLKFVRLVSLGYIVSLAFVFSIPVYSRMPTNDNIYFGIVFEYGYLIFNPV